MERTIEDDLFEIALNETRHVQELYVHATPGGDFPDMVIVNLDDERGNSYRKK